MSTRVERTLELRPVERGLAWGLHRLQAGVPAALRLPDDVRRAVTAAISQAASWSPLELARPPLPGGLQHIHPSWLQYTLLREPLALAARLARVLTAAGLSGMEGPWTETPPASLSPQVEAELVWALFGPLADPEPPPAPEGPERGLEWVDPSAGASRAVLWQRLPASVLWRALCERGASEVGRSLFRSEPVMRARAMATVGAPWAQVIARAAAGPVEAPARDRARLAVARASAMAAHDDLPLEMSGRREAEVRLAFVGLCAAGAEIAIAGPAAVRTIALRLPAVVGRWLWTRHLGGPHHVP